MGWLHTVDAWVLDRVAQPVANRLGPWAGPPALAESCLLGAAVMTAGEVALEVRADGLDPGTLFFGALNLAGAVWLLRWFRAHGLSAGNAANPLRVMPVWVSLRLLSLFDLLLSVLLPVLGIRALPVGPIGVPLSSGGPADLLDLAASALSVAGLYLAACSRPPPRPVPRPVWAEGTAA